MIAKANPKRIAGLDGLRAVAVLGVLLFHLRVPGAELGWAGVELFFVLSGYLITRILLDLRSRPRYFRTFYVRRALRILPIYFLVLGVSVWIALATGRSATLASLPFYVLYLQNYYPQIASQMSHGIPLTGHTWTLAVEEQFYWLWPLVVLLITGRTLRIVLVAMFVAAPLARLGLLLWTGNPYAAIQSLVAQVDAVAAGALLATFSRATMTDRAFVRWGALSAGAGAVLLAGLVSLTGLTEFTDPTRWAAKPLNVLVLSGMALLFAGVIAMTLGGARPLVRPLAVRPLRHLGSISYGLYLYNPLALFVVSALVDPARPTDAYLKGGDFLFAGGVVILNYGLALASWRYLEAPILRLRSTLASTAA